MGSEKLVSQNGLFHYPSKDYTIFLSLHFCKRDIVLVLFSTLHIRLKIENSKKCLQFQYLGQSCTSQVLYPPVDLHCFFLKYPLELKKKISVTTEKKNSVSLY